jgi:hypothetical protein
MLKRFALIGLFGAAGFGIAVPAQAHYVYTLSGWLYHTLDCQISLKQVPNQDTKPGSVTCEILPTTQATVWCSTPGVQHFVAGQASVGPLTVTIGLIPAGISKKGGIGTATVSVLTDEDLPDFIDACPNRYWTVEAVVLETFDTTITVKDDTGAIATTVSTSCTNPVPGTIPDEGTFYSCLVPVVQHES